MQFGYKVLRALCILYFVNICPNRGAASYLLFCYYIINSYTCQMMHRLRRYDVFRFAQNDVAPLRSAMMRCLPQCAVRHASFAKRTSSGVAVIICRRQTSFKKRTFVLVDKCSFFVGGEERICLPAPVTRSASGGADNRAKPSRQARLSARRATVAPRALCLPAQERCIAPKSQRLL